jgi:hypothetical protein
MSDDKTSTEAASLREQVAYAQQHDPSHKAAAQAVDDIDGLRTHCKTFIDAMQLRLGEGRAHQISMSRSMLEQMVFWLRAARQ